ncbi:adenylate/guanylate cyclase domain-containing protein [Nocardioides aequoreus]|uniref:adenylate/guanylate cyclase domain-containing protein n=1 Tax=Nocardioides aequoreus TaxID=397278 RepID=UPI000A9B3A14|nr:adenylate/guanylate cyclase domain-containing protein [Nocardioides aequoreus]
MSAERDLDRPARDRSELVDLLEEHLLGEAPSLTGAQVADEVGLDLDVARERWRSLGFPAVGDDVVAFTRADLEALRRTEELIGLGVVDGEDQHALVRSLGRSFARLAEWQMGLLARAVDPERMTLAEMAALVEQVTPSVDALQSYVWRRHTLLAASRMVLAQEAAHETAQESGQESGQGSGREGDAGAPGDDVEGTVTGVGFADIVGYTKQSRSLSRRELARLVDHFEGRALEIVTEHEGRIIKTIGDEIMLVADTPGALARIGLALVAEGERDDFPDLRVGLAWGPALARLGDVLGPVVNLAARLTSTARPGTVLIDRALAEQLDDDPEVSLRRIGRTSVRGYRRLEPWRLKWR